MEQVSSQAYIPGTGSHVFNIRVQDAQGNWSHAFKSTITFSGIAGCTDLEAVNYNPLATFDDGSCVYCGQTIFVSNQGDDLNTGDIDNPLLTINMALTRVCDSDTIIVMPGEYNEAINLNGLNIILASNYIYSNNTTDISSTIISAPENNRCITYENAEDSTSLLTGFTIQNGNAIGSGFSSYGGGIFCYNSSPRLENLILKDNSSSSDGGAISCIFSNSLISNLVVKDNEAIKGGGIDLKNSEVLIEHCTISSNTSTNNGGGLSMNNSTINLFSSEISENSSLNDGGGIYISFSDAYITESQIKNNISTNGNGGGISHYEAHSELLNCQVIGNIADGWASVGGGMFLNSTSTSDIKYSLFTSNNAFYGGAIGSTNSYFSLQNATVVNNSALNSAGGILIESFGTSILNSIVWDNYPNQISNGIDYPSNLSCNYSNIEGGHSGAGIGNIDTIPHFINPDLQLYYLQDISPCINAGSPLEIYNDEDGTRNDMGCFPYGQVISGCTDELAINFMLQANQDDGSCEYYTYGCTDEIACNYNESVDLDDGSCTYPNEGFDCEGNQQIAGCIWPSACNYNPLAILDDASCTWPNPGEDCDGNCAWESVASNSCESYAGLNCTDDLIAIGPSFNCGEGSRIVSIDSDGQLVLSNWYDESMFNDMVSSNDWNDIISVGIEPLSGQLYGITSEGDVVSEASCFDLDIPMVGDIVKVDMENNHGLLLRYDGIVVSFAPASANDALESTPIIYNYAVEDVACGYDFNVAVDGSQNVLFWGAPNSAVQYGYLGLPYSGGFVSIDAFGNTVGAITNNGEIVVWGEDLGGVVSSAPSTFDLARQVVLGEGFGVMVREDGTIYQWGSGTGSAEGMPSPPLGLSNVVEIGCSSNQVVAYLTDGSIVHWGINPSQNEVSGLTYASTSDINVTYELCIPGCTDPSYSNYDSLATIDDDSCKNFGCTDTSALNYDDWADTDDGSCIVVGCDDPEACNYNPAANMSIEKRLYVEHDGYLGDIDFTDQVTYRVYLKTPHSDDVVSAIGGYSDKPLNITTTTQFWQDELGSNIPDINSVLFSFIPRLEYDSWVTIGTTPESYNEMEPIYLIESNAQSWISEFELGNSIVVNDDVGGAWYGLNGYADSVVGDDGEILIAQLTTDGELSIESMYISMLLHGDENNALMFTYSSNNNECTYIDNQYSDCNGCINDSDEDGVCDEEEVLGCTDVDACNYDELATDDDGSCRLSSEEITLSLEVVATHTEGELNGHSTYRLYANLMQPEDKIDAVYGTFEDPLFIQPGTGEFYHHPFGSSTPVYFPEYLIEQDPLRAFDSYVALGWGHETQGGFFEILESTSNPWSSAFETGQPIMIDNEAGGGWYTVNDNSSFYYAGEDLQILLGQFTTTGGIAGTINIQAEGCGSVGTFNTLSLDFSSQEELLGCVDTNACNYDESATVDNESCCYSYCVSGEIESESLEILNINTGEEVTAQVLENNFNICLEEDGCYLISGASSISFDGNVIQTTSLDNAFILEAGTNNCIGCNDELACNYTDQAYFNDNSCEYLEGDFNYNHIVDVTDLLFFLTEYGQCDPEQYCVSDLNDDGYVTSNDLLIILALYDTTCE